MLPQKDKKVPYGKCGVAYTNLTKHILYTREILFIYLPAFLDTGLPRGNVHEQDSGPMRGAIPTQSHNP